MKQRGDNATKQLEEMFSLEISEKLEEEDTSQLEGKSPQW